MAVYDELEGDTKNQTKNKRQNMDGSDSIVSMIYIRKTILGVKTNSFINGMSRKKDMEHILERKADFESKQSIVSAPMQLGISLQRTE